MIGLAALVVLLPPFLPSTFYVRVVALVFINALAVLGLNMLMGFAGQVSLGHAGFFGIGAYAVAIGPTHLGMPLGFADLRYGASRANRFIVGRPILKLRGYYLAIATLGMGVLIAMVVSNEAGVTGVDRTACRCHDWSLFGWRAVGPQVWYWISGLTLVIGV